MDKTLIDVTELRMNWAVEDVAAAISELMDRLEATKDIQTLEALKKLIQALNTYIKVIGEAVSHE